MMFGNVAPAPLSCTCAAAGAAAQSSATRAMVRVVFTGSSSVWVELEHELCLEQELVGRRAAALRLHTIDVGEQAYVRAQLVRRATDDPRVAIVGGVVVRIEDVHASDQRDLARRGEVIDAEGTDDATGHGGVLHRDVLTSHRVLVRAIRQHPQVAVAIGAGRGELADSKVSRQPQATDATIVVGRLEAVGNTGLEILAEVARAPCIAFAVDKGELGVDLLTLPVSIDSD